MQGGVETIKPYMDGFIRCVRENEKSEESNFLHRIKQEGGNENERFQKKVLFLRTL